MVPPAISSDFAFRRRSVPLNGASPASRSTGIQRFDGCFAGIWGGTQSKFWFAIDYMLIYQTPTVKPRTLSDFAPMVAEVLSKLL